MLHPQAHDLTDVLEEAYSRKTEWNLERALALGEEISKLGSMSYDYDDGPPENWVDLNADGDEEAGLISIQIPLALMHNRYITDDIKAVFASESTSLFTFDDWRAEFYKLSPTILDNIFDNDFLNDPQVTEELYSIIGFWVLTVTS